MRVFAGLVLLYKWYRQINLRTYIGTVVGTSVNFHGRVFLVEVQRIADDVGVEGGEVLDYDGAKDDASPLLRVGRGHPQELEVSHPERGFFLG